MSSLKDSIQGPQAIVPVLPPGGLKRPESYEAAIRIVREQKEFNRAAEAKKGMAALETDIELRIEAARRQVGMPPLAAALGPPLRSPSYRPPRLEIPRH